MNRVCIVAVLALVACKKEPEAFEFTFAATDGAARVDCTTPIDGLGPEGEHSIGMSDLRFYVSGIEFRDADGEPVEATFDDNDFQYQGDSDWVGLIDLTSDSAGTCASGAISFSEGTARTNDVITGMTLLDEVAAVSFDVGVPQALMKEVIGAHTAEAAPSPLNEMFWSWASGYRHLVFNLTVNDGTDDGEGYVHIGSVDCAAEGELALENRDECGFVNTPSVEIDAFSLATDTVSVDLTALFDDVSFVTPVYDPDTMEVIGQTVGVACHSFPGQTDCPPIFEHLGLDFATGQDDASTNVIFGTL